MSGRRPAKRRAKDRTGLPADPLAFGTPNQHAAAAKQVATQVTLAGHKSPCKRLKPRWIGENLLKYQTKNDQMRGMRQTLRQTLIKLT